MSGPSQLTASHPGPDRSPALSQEASHGRIPSPCLALSIDVAHARTETKRTIRRLAILFGATVVVALISALAIYLLERHAHGSAIRSYGLALFWSVSQLLTLGSSLGDPVTVT